MFIKKFFEQKKTIIFFSLFLIIMAAGIFIRTYNHHDWLRFNTDQARDASVVNAVIEGEASLPLFGPKAGGTEFKLGPAFYYFQIVSAKIFGNYPDKMAYPDLIFSILAIPLLYLLMRKYFNKYISLAAVAIFSVSAFAVQYSRFAWNPNSSPFFVFLFLFAILMLESVEIKKQLLWVVLAGIALGVGMQLHTMLLVIMPIVAVLFLLYLWKRKIITLPKCLFIFFFAFVINVPQIIGEIQTGGQNMGAFLGGTESKTKKGESAIKNVANDAVCQIQANSYILSSIGNNDECGFSLAVSTFKKAKTYADKLLYSLEFLFGVIFSVGGFLLWGMAIKKEKEQQKKSFLILLGIYAIVGFLLLIPLAMEISLRFYLALSFVPFVLLGLWSVTILQFAKKYHTHIIASLLSILVFLVGYNIFSVKQSFADISGQEQVKNSTASSITLGEVEFISNYITSHSNSKAAVYLEGRQKYLFKYLKSIEYFTQKNSIKIKENSKKEIAPNDAVIFIIGNAKNKGKLTEKEEQVYDANDVAIYGRFSIAVLKNKIQVW